MKEMEEYATYYGQNVCIGPCINCRHGVCVCREEEWQFHNHSYTTVFVQRFGRCVAEKTALSLGDDIKYRKPRPLPIPSWCKNYDGRINPRFRNDPQCQLPVYPNVFDHNAQYCRRGDHNFCLGKDMNMYCTEETRLDPRS